MTATREFRANPAHSLPERPHLDHLRSEAKQRHAALKAVSQNARLSDAQFLVARDYGFPNWMALKTEVDRRRQLCGTVEPTPMHILLPRPRPRRRERALANSATVEQALFPAAVMGMMVVQFVPTFSALLRALLG